ncbi:LysR family transcriptional regulator [Ramlibacter albus]|uniref:LysR family transcriptional regulator n=1 Tax=Ramlibacter albus TaxID=2079448 RepID=A0A923M6N0_9BURK|nr:LysR family transcriptional regulator [Ramlibacter albus]MBC5764776.1 LysR family transcriptional regulator [Ramlibacter albus]
MARTGYNLARFDLLSVRLAVSCAQSGSLTAAARESHLALAAASRRIHELEDALGGPLFERHARGLTVTAAGRVFVKHGLALLQTLEQMGAEMADLHQGVARHVRLCASTAAINQFLPPLLAEYAKREPQVRIDLEEQVSDAAAAALRDGRADVGVFVEGPDVSGLQVQVFRNDELVVVLPRRHRLAGKSRLAFADALDEDWISLNTGAAMLQRQQEAALAANRPFRLRMQVRSFDAVCHLVASGFGLAVLPKAAALPIVRAMNLDWRPLADAWARRRILVATAASPEPAAQALVDFLVQPSQAANARRRKKQ